MGIINTIKEKKIQANSAQYPSLLVLTVPIFIETLFVKLVDNVDQIMISSVSDFAVGAVGNVNQVVHFVIVLFNVISMATTILVSQYIGAKKFDKLPQLYTLVVGFNLVVSIILSTILLLLSSKIFVWMKVPDELIPDAVVYMNIVAYSIVFQSLFSAYSAIFRSNGFVKFTMRISIIVNIINVILNGLLIYGYFGIPKMGVAGVAIATFISRVVGAIIAVILFKKNLHVKFSLEYFKPFPTELLKKIFRVGLPSGGENLSYTIEQMFVVAFANMCGPYSVSTKVYVGIFACFAYIYSLSIGNAQQLLVGRLIGAGEEDTAYKRVLKTLPSVMLVAFSISLLVYLFSDNLMSIVTDDPNVKSLAKSIFFVDIFLEIARSVNNTVTKSLQASGDIKFPMIVAITSMWGFGALCGYIFGIVLGYGLVGIWVGMCLDETVRATILIIRWLKGSWRGRSLVKN